MLLDFEMNRIYGSYNLTPIPNGFLEEHSWQDTLGCLFFSRNGDQIKTDDFWSVELDSSAVWSSGFFYAMIATTLQISCSLLDATDASKHL